MDPQKTEQLIFICEVYARLLDSDSQKVDPESGIKIHNTAWNIKMPKTYVVEKSDRKIQFIVSGCVLCTVESTIWESLCRYGRLGTVHDTAQYCTILAPY